jgi:hypothetical protein
LWAKDGTCDSQQTAFQRVTTFAPTQTTPACKEAHTMDHPSTTPIHHPVHALGTGDSRHAQTSAVSWAAILAGAAAAASLSLILLMLGVGFGLSSVSPWSQQGVSATTLGVGAIVWISLTQVLASGMGGYLAGRLRSKWLETPSEEVYFRDTAHGFLAWAVATLVTAALLTSAIGSIVGGGVQAASTVAAGATTAATAATAGSAAIGADPAASASNGPVDYVVDTLFRRSPGNGAAPSPDTAGRSPAQDTAEVGRIFSNVSGAGPLPDEDLRYVAQLVSQRTGLPPAEAQKRVADQYAQLQTRLREAQAKAKTAADTARKASAYSALWLFISLLIGAFAASLCATFGGRTRDA